MEARILLKVDVTFLLIVVIFLGFKVFNTFLVPKINKGGLLRICFHSRHIPTIQRATKNNKYLIFYKGANKAPLGV
jgi:hypothetical protein